MFINPKKAIKEGWLKFPQHMTDEMRAKCVQPNAIDFTIDRVFEINKHNIFAISETCKQMRGGREICPLPLQHDDYAPDIEGQDVWAFNAGQAYDCLSDFYIEVPEGVAALMVIRSTFARNGMIWTSGLYDSGFKGHIGGVVHNRSGDSYVGKGTRIGQVIFITSDSAGVYAGGWNHEQGTHYTESSSKPTSV